MILVKISYFRVNLETFCARKVGERAFWFLSRLQQRLNCFKICGFCAFGAKYKNEISRDLNTVEWCYFTMMLEIDYIFHKMIKRIEAEDVGILIFGYRLKEVTNSYVLYIVLEPKELFISLQPDVRLRWGLDENVAFKMDNWFILKNQIWILPTCDSFPLI